MKKKILAALAAVSVVTAIVPVTSAFAAETVTVKIHYDNPDAADWAVWGWATGLDGAWYSFEDGVATFTTPDIASTKFIVSEYDESNNGWGAHRESSDEKPFTTDPFPDGGDRSIDASKVVDGEINVYVAMGSTSNTYDNLTEEPVESTEDPVESAEEPVESTEEPVESTEEPVESTDDPADDPAANNTLTLNFKLDAEDAANYAIKYWGFGTFGSEKYAAFDENGEAVVTWAEDEIAEGETIGFGLALADESAEDRWVCGITMTPDVSEFNFGDTVAVVLSVSTDEDGNTVATAEATLVEGGNNGDNSTEEPADSDAPAADSDTDGKGDADNSTADNSNTDTAVSDGDTDGKGDDNADTGIALAVAPVVLAAGAVAAVVVVNKKRK